MAWCAALLLGACISVDRAETADGLVADGGGDAPASDGVAPVDAAADTCACGDGLACTLDRCEEGVCAHDLRPGRCLVDGTCVAEGERSGLGGCLVCDPDVASDAWTPREGTCDDGDPCTFDDTCAAGTCAGVPGCDDGLDCTTDSCEASGCLSTVKPGWCAIDETCHSAGAAAPEVECLVCDPDNPGAWSPADDGASCDDEDPCTSQDACEEGVCVGAPSVDDQEPNDGLQEPWELGSVEEDASFPAGDVSMSLYPSGDIDWYRFVVEDGEHLAAPRARAVVVGAPAGTMVEVCLYYACDDVGPAGGLASCEGEGGQAAEVAGLEGCCATAPAPDAVGVQVKAICGGALGRSGQATVSVRQVGGMPSCAPFLLRWGAGSP